MQITGKASMRLQGHKKIIVETQPERCHEEMVYGIGLVYISMIKEIETYLKSYDLSPTDMNILMLVKHQAETQGISQVDLGQKLMVTAHNMTRAIQRLEKKKLLKRVSYTQDARVNLVTITAKGSQLLDEVWPGYDRNLHDLANNVSVEEQKIVAGLLQKWLRNKGA
jgi:MarR family transcriptional regulator, 2-MHQ and catechol-resistance regulon repressor